MTETELKNLRPGDVIQHLGSGNAYIVVYHNDAGYPIVSRSLTAINPGEWQQVPKDEFYRSDQLPRPRR